MKPNLITAIAGVIWAVIFGVVIAALVFGAPVFSGRTLR